MFDVWAIADMDVEMPVGEQIVWIMVPACDVPRGMITEMPMFHSPGDVVIDECNSHDVDDLSHVAVLGEQNIRYVDADVPEGTFGLADGYGIMVRRTVIDVERPMLMFDALWPEGPQDEDQYLPATSLDTVRRRFTTTFSTG